VLEVSPTLTVLERHPLDSGSYQLAVSGDGRLLSAQAEVFSDTYALQRIFTHVEAWTHAVLWVGRTPVILGTAAEVVSGARIHWWDP